MKRKDQGKLIVGIFLATIFSAISQAVLADTTILGGGTNGGVITDLGGATVLQNTSTKAQIGITGNGNTIKWNTLNVGKNKQLDFNFTQNGQVALNKVLGGQMSTIAGKLTTSGANGRLIISNPAGMLFDNGAVVNANSLILTTKDVNWDGNLNGRLELRDNPSYLNSTITLNKNAAFTIADDLNIIAQNIKVNETQNVLTNNDTRLITTDGVNFIASSRNVETLDTGNTSATGNININNAKIAFQNTSTGKIYIASKGDINVTRSSIKNTTAESATKITVTGGTAYYSNVIDDSNLTAKKAITASNLNSINNSILTLTDPEKNNDIQITINSNSSHRTAINNSTFNGRFINANQTDINSSVFNAVKQINISKTVIDGSTLTSGGQVVAENSNIKDSFITGKNVITFDKISTLDNVVVNLNNTTETNLKNVTVHLNDATLINGTVVNSPKICANRSTLDDSSIIASKEMSIIDATLKNASLAQTDRFVHDRYNIVTNDDSTLRVNIQNSTLTANQNMNIIDSTLDGAIINAANKVTFNNVNSNGTSEFSATVSPTNSIAITGAHNFSVKAAAADITMDNADLVKSDLTATNNISVDNSTLGNAILNAANNLSVQNSVFTTDLNVANANKFNLKDSTVQGLIASNIDDISIEGVNATSINISNSGKILIKNSTSAPDSSVPTIAELAGDKILTDYNPDKYTSEDFEGCITGNRYGDGQRISYISGDVSISNINNIDIINSAIVGNLTETSYIGDANIITSYLGGRYTADRTGGETSIYQVYTNLDDAITPYYMAVEVPNTNNIENNSNVNSNMISFDNNDKFYIENDRKNFGEELNTTFLKHFSPRGFAASEDEMAQRKMNVLSTAKKGENNSIITTQKFIAE